MTQHGDIDGDGMEGVGPPARQGRITGYACGVQCMQGGLVTAQARAQASGRGQRRVRRHRTPPGPWGAGPKGAGQGKDGRRSLAAGRRARGIDPVSIARPTLEDGGRAA